MKYVKNIVIILTLLTLSSCVIVIDESDRIYKSDGSHEPHELMIQVESVGQDSTAWFDYNDHLIVVEDGKIVRKVKYVDESSQSVLFFFIGVLFVCIAIISIGYSMN